MKFIKVKSVQMQGFSLIELMIALLLGLILFSGVGHLILGSSRSWALQDELSRIQENARLTLDLVGQTINTAAYTGCPSQANLANMLSSNADNRQWMAHFDKGVLGLSAGTAVKQQLDSNAISEAIIVHRLDRDSAQIITGHDTGNARLSLVSQHSYDEGDLLALISPDCGQISIFRAGGATGSRVITHPASNSGNLNNCVSQMYGDFTCEDTSLESSNTSHEGSVLLPLETYAFYLRNSNGIPTLYRKKAGEYESGNSINAEALVEGVEGLLIRYGLDSDNNGVADQYLSAAEITPYSSDWLNVISVKLEILVRSFTEVAPSPQAYFFAGQSVLPNDNYVRRSFMRTIKLRNRGLK